MPWFKVDDALHKHRKARLAGTEAIGLWTLAGSWCAENLTDGFIPESVCGQWAARPGRLGAALVTAGLWTVAERDGESGWQFHDWIEYQPSAAKTRASRAAARERMRLLRGGEGVG